MKVCQSSSEDYQKLNKNVSPLKGECCNFERFRLEEDSKAVLAFSLYDKSVQSEGKVYEENCHNYWGFLKRVKEKETKAEISYRWLVMN